MRIDSHQHFWKYSAEQYPWMQPDWPIRKDHMPEDLASHLKHCGLDGSVAVQARQNLEETRWLLELARNHDLIRGVVGWVDLQQPDVDEQLQIFAPHAKFVGVRHVVQDEPDDRFLLGEEFMRGVRRVGAFELVYDLLVYPRQLPSAIELVKNLCDQDFVLDHMGKPDIASGKMSPWKEQIEVLAQNSNVYCKVSGMVTEASWKNWKPEDFKPYLDVVFQAFGPDRLLFGSDWPVCRLAATYEQACQLAENYVDSAGFTPAEKAGFFGENAARVYGLPPV